MLTLDMFAEARPERYTHAIRHHSTPSVSLNSVSLKLGAAPGALVGLGMSGRF
jgi:hypothetical protein